MQQKLVLIGENVPLYIAEEIEEDIQVNNRRNAWEQSLQSQADYDEVASDDIGRLEDTEYRGKLTGDKLYKFHYRLFPDDCLGFQDVETDVGEVTIVKPNCRNRFSMFYFVHPFSLYLFLRVFVILADITDSSECVKAFNYEVKKSLLTVRKTVRIFCNRFEQYVKSCKALQRDYSIGYCSRGVVDELIFSRERLEEIYTRFTAFKENVWQQPSAHIFNMFRFSKTFLTITFEPVVSYKESEFAFFRDSANVCTSQFRGMEELATPMLRRRERTSQRKNFNSGF